MGSLLCKDAEHAKQAKQEKVENAMLPASEKIIKQEEIHNGGDVDSDNPDIPYADEVESDQELQNEPVPRVENQHRNITTEKKNFTEENVVTKPESSVIGIVKIKNEENLKTGNEHSNVTNSETEIDHDKSENIPRMDITKDSESQVINDIVNQHRNITTEVKPFNEENVVMNPEYSVIGIVEIKNEENLKTGNEHSNVTNSETEIDHDKSENIPHVDIAKDSESKVIYKLDQTVKFESEQVEDVFGKKENISEAPAPDLSAIIDVKDDQLIPEERELEISDKEMDIEPLAHDNTIEVNIICNTKFDDDDDVSNPPSTIPGEGEDEIEMVNTNISSNITEVKSTEIDLPEINDKQNEDAEAETHAHIFLDSDIIGNDDIFLNTDNSPTGKQETKYQVEESNETNSNLMKNEEHCEVFQADDIKNSIQEPSMELENNNNNNLNRNEFSNDVEECVETSFVECIDEHILCQIPTNTDLDNIVKPCFEDNERSVEANIDETNEEMIESLDHTKSENEVEIVEISENSNESKSIPEKPEVDKINLSEDYEESKKIIEEFMKHEKDNHVKEQLQEDLLSGLHVEEKVQENKENSSLHEFDAKDVKTVSDSNNNNQNFTDEYFTNVEINIQSVLTSDPLKFDASESDEFSISNYVDIEMGITDIKEAEFIKMESDVEKITENTENQFQNIDIDPPSQSP